MTVGETIDVYVVEKNMVDFKLNLSLKRLQKDPWEIIEEKYPKDKEVEGEVTRKEGGKCQGVHTVRVTIYA